MSQTAQASEKPRTPTRREQVSPGERGAVFDGLVADPRFSEPLRPFLTPAQQRVWLKDSAAKEYPRALEGIGPTVGLRVRDVEFLRRRLMVSENAVQISGQHVVGPTKGRKNRSVPVPQFVLTELARQCEDKGPTDLVFDGRGGKYLRRSNTVTGWFQAAVKKAKVQTITPHDLRHTCASLSVSAGVNVLALQRMLGHESAKMTLDTYADLFDDDLDAVANALHARYAPACAQNVLTGRSAKPVAAQEKPGTSRSG